MSFFEALVRALIYLAFCVLAFYLTVWVIEYLGFPLPMMVMRCIMVIFVLCGILTLYRLLWPFAGNVQIWPGRPPTPPPA